MLISTLTVSVKGVNIPTPSDITIGHIICFGQWEQPIHFRVDVSRPSHGPLRSLFSDRRPGMSQIRAVSWTWVLEWKRCTANPQWTWSMSEKLLHCIPRRFQGLRYHAGFPSGSVVKNPPANAGDMGRTHRPGRSSGGGNGTPPPPMDRGAWWATVHKVTKSQTWLSNWTHMRGTMQFILISRIQCDRPLTIPPVSCLTVLCSTTLTHSGLLSLPWTHAKFILTREPEVCTCCSHCLDRFSLKFHSAVSSSLFISQFESHFLKKYLPWTSV